MSRLGHVSGHIIEAGWLAAAVVVPMYFNVLSSRVFEPDKITLLRVIVVFMALAYAVKLLEQMPQEERSSAPARSAPVSSPSRVFDFSRRWLTGHILYLAVGLFVVVYLLATVVSIAPWISLWGSYQRLQGTYTTLTYVGLFLFVASHMRTQAQLHRLITVALLTSVPISFYGVIQHLRLDPLPWAGDVTQRVASSMGNPIFLAAYIIMVVPLTLARLSNAVSLLRAPGREARPVAGTGFVDFGDLSKYAALLVAQNGLFIIFVRLSGSSANLWWAAPGVLGVFLGLCLLFRAPAPHRRGLRLEALGYSLLLALQLLTIILTQSRGPLLGLLAGLFTLGMLLALRRQAKRLLTASVAGAVVVGGFLILFNLPNTPLGFLKEVSYIGRLGTLTDRESPTSKVRLLIWQGTWQLMTTLPNVGLAPDPLRFLRPFLGYGPEAMHVAYNKVYPPDLAHYEARNASPDRNHNSFMDYVVTTGLLGLASYLFLLGIALYLGWKTLRKAEDFSHQVTVAGVMAMLVAHEGELLFGIAIVATQTYLWLALGMMSVLALPMASESPATASQRSASVPTTITAPARIGSKRKRGKQARGPVVPGATHVGAFGNTNWLRLYVLLSVLILVILLALPPLEPEAFRLATIGGAFWLLAGIAAAATRVGSTAGVPFWQRSNWWAYLLLVPLTGVILVANLDAVTADIFYKRGFTRDGYGQWEGSVMEYQEAVALAPGQDYYYLFLGRALMELAKIDPQPDTNPPFQPMLGDVLKLPPQKLISLGRGDMLRASRVILEEAKALNPLNTDHYANLARLYRYWGEVLDRGKLALSLDYYQQATALSPNAAHLYVEWAQALLVSGLPELALEKAQRGAQLDPIFLPAQVVLGDAYQAAGQMDKAAEAHARALMLHPRALSDTRSDQRLNVYLEAGKGDFIALAYQHAIERSPREPILHAMLGYIYSRQGKLAEAAQEFEEGIKLDPRDWIGYRNLALTYQQLGEIDKAVAAAKEAERYAPGDQAPALRNFISELEKGKP